MSPEGRWVHLGAHWGSLVSSRVVGFSRVCPGGLWVHPVLLVSLGCSLGVDGFIRAVVLILVRPEVLWVHPGCLSSLECVLDVVGLIRGRWIH